MRPLLSRMLRRGSAQALVLLAVIGLIVTPPLVTGYAHVEQAESLLKDNDISGAAAAYERAAWLLPWYPGLWEQAGQLRFKLGEHQRTVTLLERAGSLSASGWDILGVSYWGLTGDLDRAVEIWRTGQELYPSYAKISARLAIAFNQKNDYPAERNALEGWVAAEGNDDARAHYRLGQLLAASEPERALQEFLAASSLDPAYESAVETMRTALNLAALEPDASSKLVLTGRGLGLVGEWPLALDAFRQAVETDGKNAEAWAWLGEAEQQLGRGGRAELDRAVSLGRTNPIVRSLRGLYWMRQNRGDQALAEYLLAAEYDPHNPARQLSIGDAYALRGDLQAGLAAYLRAVEMDPTDADLWRLLATYSTRYNLQVEDVGLPAARKAVELGREDPLALDMLGWTLTLLERYDQAQEALEHALRLDPDLAPAHLHLAVVAMQMDDWGAAHEHLQQARKLDPDGLAGEQAQLLLDQYFP